MKKSGLALLTLLVFVGIARAAEPAGRCVVQSGPTVPPVLELYTSEGCDSCPPMERWLAAELSSRPEVLAAAFHVDYWDQLGWKDRFASPAHAARQRASIATSGARFAYTPQLILNGRDWRGSRLPAASTTPAPVALKLQRLDGEQVGIELRPLAGAPSQLRLWWAALEDGHQSQVMAGENHGVLLKHERVVRDYALLAAGPATQMLTLRFSGKGEAGRARRLLVVATEPVTGRVLQAAELRC